LFGAFLSARVILNDLFFCSAATFCQYFPVRAGSLQKGQNSLTLEENITHKTAKKIETSIQAYIYAVIYR
jgi:hypothetical protein